ncbi:MAG: hypothetical protein RIR91_205 [Verrucomicrobiota bacterium]
MIDLILWVAVIGSLAAVAVYALLAVLLLGSLYQWLRAWWEA